MKPISAAERKRQIRERRRQSKQRRTSISTTSETASDCTFAKNIGNHGEDIGNREQNNIHSLNNDTGRSFLHNDEVSKNDTNKCKEGQLSSKTLFSVVMSRSNKDESSNTNNDEVASKDKNDNTATTPKARTYFSPIKSPGGYDVLKALDVANVYNEHLGKFENESGSNQGDNDVEIEDEWMDAHVISKRNNLTSDTVYEGSVKENLLSGMEAEFVEETRQMIDKTDLRHNQPTNYDETVGIGVSDWSLKRRLRIESFPGRCLPGTRRQRLDDGFLHQLAIQYLSQTSVGGLVREPSIAESLEARWKASTMYYQHPSSYPLPQSILQENIKAEQSDENLSSFIRGPCSIHHRLRLAGCGTMGGLGESTTATGEKTKNVSTTSKLLEQRRCEWKEAFRSLFNSWKTKLRDLEERSTEYFNRNGKMNDMKYKLPTTDEVLRCSFYLLRPEQVVLFRSRNMRVEVDGQIMNCIMPMIVFSSTNSYLRSMLSSMGIELRVLNGLDSTGSDADVFSEQNLNQLDAQRQTNEMRGDNESVHAELEAIKLAGDNVTVAQQNKKRKLGEKSFTSPLYCVGYNDCAAVFELFINTCGLSLSPKNSPFNNDFDTEVSLDVPLLLSRSLAPCMHFALKTLCVSGQRDYEYLNQLSSSREDRKEDNNDVRSTLELRGPILPCALRDITSSLVDWMMVDRSNTKRASTRPRKTNATDEGVGSHHFAIFLQPHEGECPVSGTSPTGLSSTSLFNGADKSFGQNGEMTWLECSHGELLNVIVWDIQRAHYISYNSKHV